LKSSTRPRRTSNLSVSLLQQLNSYALAASAASVGVLALSLPAEAKIIYTPVHQAIGERGSYLLDLNHDSIVDFTIFNTFGFTDFYVFSLAVVPTKGNSVLLIGGDEAEALKRGARVGSSVGFFDGGAEMLFFNDFCGRTICYESGQWANVRSRYLGLRFTISGQTHYGWARLNVFTQLAPGITAIVTGYAYETVPNKAIITGKTKGPDVITMPADPEAGTLGHLARGRK
jgi:hypothetical protein